MRTRFLEKFQTKKLDYPKACRFVSAAKNGLTDDRWQFDQVMNVSENFLSVIEEKLDEKCIKIV